MINATIRRHVFCALMISALAAPSARADFTFQRLASFDGGISGINPGNLTLDASGNLYGFTNSGGPTGNGTVFELAKGSSSITTLANFGHATGTPVFGAMAIDLQGNLYTTRGSGGANNLGTVIEVAKGSNTVTVLATFDGTNGSYPKGSVSLDAQGNLYGTTGSGGPHGDGTVFELAKGSNSITTLASFNGANGLYAQGQVTLDANGNIYSTTGQGGTGVGTVFELAHGSSTITTLANFPDAGPNGLTFDAQGNIWGATAASAANPFGTIYEIIKSTMTLTTVATFNGANGSEPNPGNLVFDSKGNLYGTTTDGGAYNDGTVFEIAHGSSTITTLYSFSGADGQWPNGSLSIDSNGNLYGSTWIGGANGDGTVFELVNTGAAVPEPSSFALLGLGGIGLALFAYRRRRAAV